MRTVLIETEYDGSGFHGWQIQPGIRTVQGDLERALARVCGERIHLHGTSRTDAGVHAYGQTASFAGNFRIPTERIPVAVNNLLEDVRVKRAVEKPSGFHARYAAVGKTYLYRISISDPPDIFTRNYRYRLNKRLNTGKMKEAASHLTGTHDFNAFRASGGQEPKTTVRTIHSLCVSETEGVGDGAAKTIRLPAAPHEPSGRIAPAEASATTELFIRITGDGFLYNMVRIIAGTLAEVGAGVRSPDGMKEILMSGERSRAGHTAPACGLYLERVYFSAAELNRSGEDINRIE
ncbi:MAG: tRNA pseudouridine synthase A [Clostridiales Family XIII bacterium]|jgi:tRNA pseudouridine38-40 synthase|nr:tRNA pseudouridine synthase A [Clostridiales Family XIII bacterium]